MTFTIIESHAELADACAHWHSCDYLAIDTEFERTKTFYPKLGLIQVFDGGQVYLIDPLPIADLSPLAAVLENTSVLKLVHAPLEDLEVIRRSLGCQCIPMWDTQRAAAIANMSPALSLQALCEALTGVTIDKGESRSDWMARPLSQAQLAYAADDVRYLPQMYQALLQQLSEERRGWVLEDGELMQQQNLQGEQETERYFERINGAGKLSGVKFYVLVKLAAWRELKIRELDVPRKRFLSDAALLQIAQALPENNNGLLRLSAVHGGFARKQGEAVLALIDQCRDSYTTMAQESLPRSLTVAEGRLLKQLKARIRDLAEKEWLIAPEILLRKTDYQLIMRSRDAQGRYHWPESLSGWRKGLLHDAVLDFLNAQTRNAEVNLATQSGQ